MNCESDISEIGCVVENASMNFPAQSKIVSIDADASDATACKPIKENGDITKNYDACIKKDKNEVEPVSANRVMPTDNATEIFTDAMIEKLQENFDSNVDGEINLLESDNLILDAENEVKESETNEALNLLLQGKRNLLVKDFDSAVITLGGACQKFSSIYGEFAKECGEAYYTYGQALLELWRVEDRNKKEEENVDEIKNGINSDIAQTGNVINGDNEINDENEATNDETDEIQNNGEKETDDNVEYENEEDGLNENENGDDDGQNENENEEDEIDLEEDVDNLQLAWEIFETAKSVFSKSNDNLNLAKVHTKLGEISIASGNYALAIDDLKCSLEILEKLANVDIRLKANNHFHLYIAHSMNCCYDDAEAELRKAKSDFESQLCNLEKKLTILENETEVRDSVLSEINEITDIVRDINAKILESHKEKRELMAQLSEVIRNKIEDPNQSMSYSSSSASTVNAAILNFSPVKSSVPVNNISHLVRKKPKVLFEENESGSKNIQTEENKICDNEDSVLKNNEDCATSKITEKLSNNVTDSLGSKRKANDEIENTPKKMCFEKNDS